jgi:hypothetical protein
MSARGSGHPAFLFGAKKAAKKSSFFDSVI